MIDTPQISQTTAQHTAVIRLMIPREQIKTVMGPAIGEVMGTIAAQGLRPVGPVFSRHFRMDPGVFDFEIGVPVSRPATAAGRVKAGTLAAAKVISKVYTGPYEGLGAAWGAFCEQIQSGGHAISPELWERYLAGPESSPDPAKWQTELIRPLTE